MFERGEIKGLPFEQGQVQPASLDLRMGARACTVRTFAGVEVLATLQHKGLVSETAAGHRLTEAGRVQTEALWDIALRQQEAVFAGVDPDDIETFKKVLKVVMETS